MGRDGKCPDCGRSWFWCVCGPVYSGESQEGQEGKCKECGMSWFWCVCNLDAPQAKMKLASVERMMARAAKMKLDLQKKIGEDVCPKAITGKVHHDL